MLAWIPEQRLPNHFFRTGGMPNSMHGLSGVRASSTNNPSSRPHSSNKPKPYFSVYSGPLAGIYRTFRKAQGASAKGDGLYLRLDNRSDAIRFFRTGNAPIGMEATIPRPTDHDQVEPEESGVDFGEDIVLTPTLMRQLFGSDGDGSLHAAHSTLRIRVEAGTSLSGSPSRISTAVA